MTRPAPSPVKKRANTVSAARPAPAGTAGASGRWKSFRRISTVAHTAPTRATPAVTNISSFSAEAKLDRSARPAAARSAAGSDPIACATEPDRTAFTIAPADPASDDGSADVRWL
jgi:hypothetical protein